MLKLYDYAQAPNPRRARMILSEKGIAYEKIQIDLQKGEQHSDSFVKVNPRRTVPALVTEDGNVIAESVAIAAYADDIQPEKPILGASAIEKARVLEWNSRAELEGLFSVADAFRNAVPGFKNRAFPGEHEIAQIPELVDRGKKRTELFFKTLNAQLSENEYVAGDNFSLADITALAAIDFAKWIKMSPDSDLEDLHSWYERVNERPSAQA